MKSHYRCWENSGKGLTTALGTISLVRSGSGRKGTGAVLPWLCASHRGLQRKWEFQIPRSCNTWLLQDNSFPCAQLYQIAAEYAISWPAFWFMESIIQPFNVPSESPMPNWLLSRFSTNETIYVQKESCQVWWQRPVILALGRWRRKIKSSSLPWSLTPVRVHEALSQTEKKKRQNKNNPKGMLSGHFSRSRSPQAKGQAIWQGRMPPFHVCDIQMAFPMAIWWLIKLASDL